MKPADDIGTCVERGEFRFRPGPFQEQAPRPGPKLGLKELEKPFKRCQSPCRDNIGSDESIQKTQVPRLNIIPTVVDLSAAEVELSDMPDREFRLRGSISRISASYDYIIIDCPPSLGMLTVNALAAATSVLVPLQCEFYALEGLSQLMRTIDSVKAGLNGALSMQGIVLTMFDSRNKLSAMVANDVRDHFGELVYNTVVPRNVRVSEAPSFGQPVLIYDLKCPGSQAYAALAAELLRQEAKAA